MTQQILQNTPGNLAMTEKSHPSEILRVPSKARLRVDF